MFDYHIHTTVSYDGHGSPKEMALAARAAGLQEICFTDHLDYRRELPPEEWAYLVEDYNAAYEALEVPGLTIRYGTEVGLTPWNVEMVARDLALRQYDFVLGSLHFIDDEDPYSPPYWVEKSVDTAEQEYFDELYRCVKLHNDFDVLGHITYMGKVAAHPARRPVELARYRDCVAEIMKVLIDKGKGIEVNTSGIDRLGCFLPDKAYLQLFRDLGGEIVTVGSDSHDIGRVGQYCREAVAMVQEIFGHVCVFQGRKPMFYK